MLQNNPVQYFFVMTMAEAETETGSNGSKEYQILGRNVGWSRWIFGEDHIKVFIIVSN